MNKNNLLMFVGNNCSGYSVGQKNGLREIGWECVEENPYYSTIRLSVAIGGETQTTKLMVQVVLWWKDAKADFSFGVECQSFDGVLTLEDSSGQEDGLIEWVAGAVQSNQQEKITMACVMNPSKFSEALEGIHSLQDWLFQELKGQAALF